TMVGPEADEIGVFSVRRPAKTADIVLSTSGHFGGRRVTDVRVMLPDHDSGFRAVEGEQRVQRLEHVLIAQIPGSRRAVVERAIVLLSIGNEPGVLRGIEE